MRGSLSAAELEIKFFYLIDAFAMCWYKQHGREGTYFAVKRGLMESTHGTNMRIDKKLRQKKVIMEYLMTLYATMVFLPSFYG